MDPNIDEAWILSKELGKILEINTVLSENETLCSPSSFLEEFSKNYEQELDNMLENYQYLNNQDSERIMKKRGRKLLRPNDPIRKKTEIKDKYWFRAFRNFIKTNFSAVKRFLTPKQTEFWNYYISDSGKPGKGSNFLSYGKNYKNFLFSEPSFLDLFKAWLLEFGETELSKRYSQGSDLWFIYYDYALKEIAETRSSSSYFRDILKNKFKVQDSNETIDHFFN